jgi:hypothetical protein
MDSGSDAGGRPRVVLAPMNLAIAPPADLDDAVPIVENALVRALRARGAQVAMIWPPDARALWQAAYASVVHTGDPSSDLQATARAFHETLRRSESYDLLLFPSLALREARVMGRYARWDGVRRRVPVRTRGSAEDAHAAPDAPVFDAGGLAAAPEYGGHIAGLSLHLLGYRPDYDPIERWAGLDVVHETVQVRHPSGAKAEMELRPRARILGDAELVDEGVAQGLDPIWSRVR